MYIRPSIPGGICSAVLQGTACGIYWTGAFWAWSNTTINCRSQCSLKTTKQPRFWECMCSHFCVLLAVKGAGLQRCFCCVFCSPLQFSTGCQGSCWWESSKCCCFWEGILLSSPSTEMQAALTCGHRHWPESSTQSLANEHQLTTSPI